MNQEKKASSAAGEVSFHDESRDNEQPSKHGGVAEAAEMVGVGLLGGLIGAGLGAAYGGYETDNYYTGLYSKHS